MDLHSAYRRWRWLTGRLRGLRLTLLIRACGGMVGQRLIVEKGIILRRLPTAGWRFGDDVYLGYGVLLDVHSGAEFALGNRVKIMHYTVVGVAESVRFADDSGIAEQGSVRDANHRMGPGDDTNTSPLESKPISIGLRSAIGRGCAVLAGAQLGTEVFVGANSVVRGEIPSHSVAVGAPAKPIRSRGLD